MSKAPYNARLETITCLNPLEKLFTYYIMLLAQVPAIPLWRFQSIKGTTLERYKMQFYSCFRERSAVEYRCYVFQGKAEKKSTDQETQKPNAAREKNCTPYSDAVFFFNLLQAKHASLEFATFCGCCDCSASAECPKLLAVTPRQSE